MALDLVPEVALVLPLHLGHDEERTGVVLTSQDGGEAYRVLVLAYVAALEPPSAVHGREPPGYATKQGDEPANRPHQTLPAPIRLRPEPEEHGADRATVLPLLATDLPNFLSLSGIVQGERVPFVGKRGTELA